MKTQLNTKRAYVNSVPICHGEITVVTSDSADDTVVHATRLGLNTQKAGVPTLIVNTGMSRKRFTEHFHAQNVDYKHPRLLAHTSIRGDLVSEGEEIRQIIVEANIGIIVIAGWEWASSNYRRKQRLIFFLREMMDLYNVAVIIYSHTTTSPEAGKKDYGGIGNLGLLVAFVVAIDTSERLEDVIKKPTPMTYGSAEEYAEAERSAQVLINKINELGSGSEAVEGKRDEGIGTGRKWAPDKKMAM
jgi:hypothetical protein